MANAEPTFSNDWLTKQVWQFERYLLPLRDKPCRLIEIGCFEGRTTCWLLDNVVRHPGSTLVCIDIWEQPVFRPNLGDRSNIDRMTLLLGRSRDVLPRLGPPASFDFVYVDGGHATIDVLEDAVLAFRLLKVGGIIGFDDYQWKDRTSKEDGTPEPAIKTFSEIYGRKLVLLNKGYQVWIRKTSD